MNETLFTPENRMKLAKFLLIISIIGWPITALTVFKHEPQGVLGLSWLAIILTSVDILFTSSLAEGKKKKKN